MDQDPNGAYRGHAGRSEYLDQQQQYDGSPDHRQRHRMHQIESGAWSPNVVAACSYVLGWISGIIVLCWKGRGDPFVRFHAWQSIFVFVAISIVWVVIKAIFALPLLGIVLGCVLGPLLGVLTAALWLGLIVLALLGRRVKIPILGDWAESLAHM